jgi:CheY-like chemotaxis protein
MPRSNGHYPESVVPFGRGQGGAYARRSPVENGFKLIGGLDDEAGSPETAMVRGLRDILIVDPDPRALLAAQVAVQSVAEVEVCSDFRAARARLTSRPPDLLVTNIRLERFNGLHLMYVAAGTATRCIVYASHHDEMLAREVLAAGAFYERADTLPRVLASYLHGMLPRLDRRSLAAFDRRSLRRGGRRSSDS